MDASHPEICFIYTVIIPASPQETVEEAGIEPGTAALQSGSPSRALADWATTFPTEPPHPPCEKIFILLLTELKLSVHRPYVII
jgi:hypothetical protein